MGFIKWLLSVNPSWRNSFMHPKQYRPPSSSEAPYAPPVESCLTPDEYRYSDNRDAKRHNPATIVFESPDKVPIFKLKEYRMQKEDTTNRNPGEYFNVEYYK